jgi:glucosyl-3-phosphoglycerate synthase
VISRFSHLDFDLSTLRRAKSCAISVVLPTKQVAATVGPIVEELRALEGLIDQIAVVDSASDDGTPERAESAGAEVYQERELCQDFGPVLGKGDAMWRALSVARGDLIVYLDADTADFRQSFALGLLGPLLRMPDICFVKGSFKRPFVSGGISVPNEGGRVTELMARPLLSAFYSELSEFRQPLAGEVAARRSLLEQIRFATGYGAEITMLLEAHSAVGLCHMAEADLGERLNRHQTLYELGPMAYTVLCAVMARLCDEGRLDRGVSLGAFRGPDGELAETPLVLRPPMRSPEVSV